jgi:hypothetical protein
VGLLGLTSGVDVPLANPLSPIDAQDLLIGALT